MQLAQPYADPWRRAAIFCGVIAVVELVALFGALVALLGLPALHHVQNATLRHELRATQPAAATKLPPAGAPKLMRDQTSVLVLNGNGEAGAAATEAARVRARGYKIGDVGNAPRSDYGTTLVMYAPGYRAEGERLARDLQLIGAQPLDGLTRAQLKGAQVAVILGR